MARRAQRLQEQREAIAETASKLAAIRPESLTGKRLDPDAGEALNALRAPGVNRRKLAEARELRSSRRGESGS